MATTEPSLDYLNTINKELTRKSSNSRTHNFVSTKGGEIVHMTAFEPDPKTFRGDYYYNCLTNKLYKKLKVTSTDIQWRRING